MATRSRGRIRLLRPLGFFGLDHLDAVVLAALADGRPLLLVGPHGTAKSELLNALTRELGLRHRHYNASLLSFDDLVGYPVPDRESGRMEFLETPASIWGAQSVLLDEISRCRPETANKLFSIVHEARVQGLELPDLRYRWAAMNPPPAHEDDGDTDRAPEETYLGSMPLDPALADRFAWVVRVPSLEELPVPDRRDLVARGGRAARRRPRLLQLVAETRARFEEIPAAERDWTVSFVEALVDPLAKAGLPISGRRAVFLRDSVLWARAALDVLRTREGLPDAALLALRNGLPHPAGGRVVRPSVLAAIHRAAVELAGRPEDTLLREIRAEKDPVRRIALAFAAPPTAIDRGALSRLVTDAVAGMSKPRRWALALLVLRQPAARRLDGPTLEVLAEPLEKVAAWAASEKLDFYPGPRARAWTHLLAEIERLREAEDPDVETLGNLLYTLFVVEAEDFSAAELVAAFQEWRALLEEDRERSAA